MNQTPLTNMEGRWVKSSKQAFDALVAMGYKATLNYRTHSRYDAKYLFIENNKIDSVSIESSKHVDGLKQAYFYQGKFWDEPEEVDEKVPFPELEDIEWVMVEAPESLWNITDDHFSATYSCNSKIELNAVWYNELKLLHENSKDFKVTWKLKEKIDRRLHVNRPLALAIGRWLDEDIDATGIKIDETTFLIRCSTTGKYFRLESLEDYESTICTLPDDYVIPDQVIEWMHEYDKESK